MNANGSSAVESVPLGSPCEMRPPHETPTDSVDSAMDQELTALFGGPYRQGEANPRPAARPAVVDGLGEKDGVAPESTTLDDAIGADAIDQSEGCGAVDDPADSSSDDAGEPNDGALEPAPANDSTDEAKSVAGGDDDLGDESDRPQLSTSAELPADFDWRKLTPRVYGKSLPPLDPADRQTLKESIISRGFVGSRILIDKKRNIIDGNARWEICIETGIVPAVEVIQGLSEDKEQSEWEKEDLALSCNLDRRQLDKEDAAQVFEARLDHLLNRRRTDKKLTQEKVAAVLGVSKSTVSARERFRHDSEGGTMSKPDARRKYDDDRKREAVRLVKEGMAKADVARKLCMSVKAVERAEKEEKDREAGGSAAESGKRKKAATAKPLEPMEDIAASNGIPDLHRRAIEPLGQDTEAYIERFKASAAKNRKDVEVASDNEELVNFSVLCSTGLALATFRLGKSLDPGGDEAAPPGDSRPDRAGNEPDTVLRGIVIADEPDEVCVALPVGGGGVIDKRNGYLAIYGQPKVDEVIRVRVEGFDWKRGLWKLQRQARQTVAPAPGAIAGPHRDDRFSPNTKLAGRKAGPTNKEVTK